MELETGDCSWELHGIQGQSVGRNDKGNKNIALLRSETGFRLRQLHGKGQGHVSKNVARRLLQH